MEDNEGEIIGYDSELDGLIKQDIEKNREENKTPEVVTPEIDKEKEVLSNTEIDKSSQEEKKVEEPKNEDVVFDINSFNKAFGTEYKSTDDIKGTFSTLKEVETLRASISEKDKALQEKETLLASHTDGLRLFANDKMYKVNQVLIKNPDLNQDAVTKLVTSNIDEMKDSDVLKMQKKIHLKDGTYDESIIEYAINKKYGLNVNNPAELEGDELKEYRANEFLRKEDADRARQELKSLVDVKMPEKIDLLAMQSEQKTKAEQAFADNLKVWDSKAKEIISSLDKYKVQYDKDDTFEFAYDDGFKEYLGKYLPELAARLNLNINDAKSIETLKGYIQRDFENKNVAKILKVQKENLLASWADEAYRKKHNIVEPSHKEAPDKISADDKKNKEVNDRVISQIKQNDYF